MADLAAIIRNLIATEKEGDYWDFKQEHHAKPGDLIKDIICLANITQHAGDRYIIYGVDNTGMKQGVPQKNRKTQADIVGTLSKAEFAGGVYPEIYLQQIVLEGQKLDVLLIKDRPEKPYYLQRGYNKFGIRLNAGTVYSRVRDSNTPSDQVASSLDIERMWRQRFGLEQPPLPRVRSYLQDRDEWVKTSEFVWYYSRFPEFTISSAEEEVIPVRAGENWVRAALSPSAFVRIFRIRFHQTVLAEIECIHYDEMRGLTPKPQVICINPEVDHWFFSLRADTLEFQFLQFLTGAEQNKLMKNGLNYARGGNIPVLFFISEDEEKAFIAELECNPVTVESRHEFHVSINDSETSERDRNVIAFSRAVIERFNEWKMSNP